MARTASPTALTTRLQELLDERQQHNDAIVRIDATLSQVRAVLGDTVSHTAKPATTSPTAPKGRKRRTRGRYAISGVDSILAFVKEHKNPTTQEIKGLWKQDGRGGSADNVLSTMVSKKQLKRQKLKGQRGSRYMLA